MELDISTGCAPESCIVDVSGEVDVSNADELRDAINDIITNGTATSVDIDLTKVPYIDSTGIGVLVGATHRAREAAKTVSVVCPNENILRVFNLLGVDEQLDVRSTR